MRAPIILALLAATAAATVAHGASQVEVRLVRAHQEEGISSSLSDVAPLLRAHLPYPGFDQITRAQVPLPAAGQPGTLAGGRLVVHCTGPQERLSVVVRRGNAVLLNTTVALRAGVPVILGGFPEGRDRLLLILVAR